MLNWKKTAAVLLMVVLTATVVGCSNSTGKATKTAKAVKVVTDIKGRRVELPKQVQRMAVVPLPWASVVYALNGGSERLAAVHPGAMTAYTGRFLETQDKHFATLDTKIIGQNFSVNMESAAQAGIDAVVLWSYQEKEAAKLGELGIPAVLIDNSSVERLQQSFMIVGQVLGEEQRAEQINNYYDATYRRLSAKKAWEASSKPTVLFLRNAKLRLQGNDNFIHEAIRVAGGNNPFDQTTNGSGEQSIAMEEVYRIDPDIILLSNFDKFVPDDLYENRIPGQDWGTVRAVQEHRIYKVPLGIYRWDAPGVETPLMMEWLAHVLQPELFQDVEVRKDARAFYKDFMHYELQEGDLARIFADAANKNSRPLF